MKMAIYTSKGTIVGLDNILQINAQTDSNIDIGL